MVSEGFFWMDLYMDMIINKIVVSYIVFIKYEGEVKGVFGVDVDVFIIKEEILRVKFGKIGYLFVVNLNGIVIIYLNSDFVGKFNIFEDLLYLVFFKVLERKDIGVIEMIFNGKDVLVVFLKSSVLGWIILLVVFKEEMMVFLFSVLERVRGEVLKSFVLSFFVFLVVGIVLVFFSVKYLCDFFRFIEEFIKVVELIGEGKLEEVKWYVLLIDYLYRDDEIGKFFIVFEVILKDVIGMLNGVIVCL